LINTGKTDKDLWGTDVVNGVEGQTINNNYSKFINYMLYLKAMLLQKQEKLLDRLSTIRNMGMCSFY
jgi:hypothetical protein